MSLLMVTQYDDWVELVSDTLVVRGVDDRPHMYHPKVFPLPHLNMVLAATGTAEVAAAWYEFISQLPDMRDVDDLDAFATEKLREFQADVAKKHGDAETTTIYHYGFPTGSSEVVAYTYSSMAGMDFKSERFHGNRFMVKPGPQNFEMEFEYEPEGKIAMATRLREEQLAFRDAGEDWVPIGGELWALCLKNHNIRTMRWHRFPDYDENLPNYV